MRTTSKERLIATSVQIAFKDGSESFRVAEGATLADISENLDKIGKDHEGGPLSIDVQFRTPKDSVRAPAAAHPRKSSSMSRQRTPDLLAAIEKP
jgi:hypothetical protein